MSQILRVYESSNLDSMLVNLQEANTFKAIGIRVSGTAGATAPVLGDVGRIGYWKNNKQMVDAGFDALSALTNMLGGNPATTWSASSAGNFYAYIPRRFGDTNVDHVIPSDNATLKCTFESNLNTRVASGDKVEVYLDLEDGVQQYDLGIFQVSDSISGASVRPISVDIDNILAVFLSATVSAVFTTTGSNITQVSTSIGGRVSDASIGALQDDTNAKLNLETAAVLATALYMADGDITSRLHDGCTVKVTTSGASTPELLILSAMFDENRLDKSINVQASRYNAQMTRKASSSRKETVSAVSRITGR